MKIIKNIFILPYILVLTTMLIVMLVYRQIKQKDITPENYFILMSEYSKQLVVDYQKHANVFSIFCWLIILYFYIV